MRFGEERINQTFYADMRKPHSEDGIYRIIKRFQNFDTDKTSSMSAEYTPMESLLYKGGEKIKRTRKQDAPALIRGNFSLLRRSDDVCSDFLNHTLDFVKLHPSARWLVRKFKPVFNILT